MKRRLFNLAAITSLLLCLACLFMWVRSGYTMDHCSRENTHGGYERSMLAISFPGYLQITTVTGQRPTEWPARQRWDASFPSLGRWVGVHWPLPQYQRETVGSIRSSQRLILPYWLLTLGSSILPAIWLWKWRKANKVAHRRGFGVLPAPTAKAP